MSQLPNDELARELSALARELDGFRVGAPPRALLEQTLARARRELRARVAERRLPAGFRRELARVAALAAPALALVVAWNVYALPRLPGLLGHWLPTPLANGLAFGYAGAALVCSALAAALLPIAAHQRARWRAREA